MSIRPRISELSPYDFTPQAEGVKLDQNEMPSDMPESLRLELAERIGRVALNRYPDLTAHALRIRLAELHDWPIDGIVVTPGSNVLIQCLVIATGIGQRVVVPKPTFGVYSLQARMLEAQLSEVPMLGEFELPLAGMLKEMATGRGVVFVANPAAPSGNLHPREQLEALIAAADQRWTIVIDEAYHQFAGSDFLDLARSAGVLSLRTLSKAFGLAGARVGYALTSPELAAQLRKTVNPFAVSALQQAAALTMLDHHELVSERAKEVAGERDWLFDRLLGIPEVTPFPSRANFILLRLADGPRSYRALLERGVIVRRQDGGMLNNCLRVSVGTRAENLRFLEALRQVVVEVGDE